MGCKYRIHRTESTAWNCTYEGVADHVRKFMDSDCEGSVLLNHVKNPKEFGIAVLNEDGEITKLIEKPKNPPTDLAVIGVYMFRSKIFDAVEELKPSKRGLLEITDAVQWLIDNNYNVKSSIVSNWWKDTGKPEDILDANRLILDDIKYDNKGRIVNSEFRGRGKIGKNTVVESNSLIKGPIMIGENCKIDNSYIGPYTSIGNNCEIIGSEIEDSVIMDEVKILNGGRITDSLIGRGVKIVKRKRLPNGKRLVIGDYSEVSI